MRVTPLPYRADSAATFSPIASEPWSVFLDSGHPYIDTGRWDILSARPFATLISRGNQTQIEDKNGIRLTDEQPFKVLRSLLGEKTSSPDFPFAGGALGYFTYDLARQMGELAINDNKPAQHPDMAVGLYDWAVLVDHHLRQTHLVSSERHPETAQIWDTLTERFTKTQAESNESWAVLDNPRSNLSWPQYLQAFQSCQQYIANGDCYQINLTQEFSATVQGSRWGLYKALRKLNPAPFSAYIHNPYVQVLSTSPERFIELRSDIATTKPIKGTRPRRPDQAADECERTELAHSNKDQAENLMIVDLLRNDLGKVSNIGSVRVTGLFEIESFANVHHMVSTVQGQLAPGLDALDLLRATFPGGSITGAPKRRAMAIIDELEPHRRGIYCGSIGYIGFNGDMDTNIAIRTLVSQGNTVRFGVGGGIVADSVATLEYQECFDKAHPILKVLQVLGRV